MVYYHVILTQRVPESAEEVWLDLKYGEIKRLVVEPRAKGKPITLNGKSIPQNNIERTTIIKTEESFGDYLFETHNVALELLENEGTDVTNRFIIGPPGEEFEEQQVNIQQPRPATDAREVFVVHGRNLAARNALFDFLRAIDLHPLEWSEAVQDTGKPSPYTGEILDAAFSRAHAIVVLFTPDDEARLRNSLQNDNEPPHEVELTGQARPNVLFEAGMAMGHSQDRTVLVELGALPPFSDIAGRHMIRLDNTAQQRQQLAQRLELAGCPVNREGTGWHTSGDFEATVAQFVQVSSDSPKPVEQDPVIDQPPQLSEEALSILTEANYDSSGLVFVFRSPLGMTIHVNNKNVGGSGDRRLDARYEKAFDDLLTLELIADNTGVGKHFSITQKGFEVLDSLLKEAP